MRDQNLGAAPATGPMIMAFGDSFTEGYAAGNDETWPANLERMTGRRVLNAGVRGYGLDQIVLRAERVMPQLKPPTVVLAFIADDVVRTALSVREARASRTSFRKETGWRCAMCRPRSRLSGRRSCPPRATYSATPA